MKYLLIEVDGLRGVNRFMQELEERIDAAFEEYTSERGYPMAMVTVQGIQAIRRVVRPPGKTVSESK